MHALTVLVILLLLWDTTRNVILGALQSADAITLVAIFLVAWYVFQQN